MPSLLDDLAWQSFAINQLICFMGAIPRNGFHENGDVRGMSRWRAETLRAAPHRRTRTAISWRSQCHRKLAESKSCGYGDFDLDGRRVLWHNIAFVDQLLIYLEFIFQISSPRKLFYSAISCNPAGYLGGAANAQACELCGGARRCVVRAAYRCQDASRNDRNLNGFPIHLHRYTAVII